MTGRPSGRLAARGLVAALLLSTSGCPFVKTYTQKPTVKLEKVDVKNVTFQGADLLATLDVENRIPVAITMGKITWAVSIDGNRLVGGDLNQGVSIPASAHAPVALPFAIKFQDLWAISQKYKDQDTAPYHLEGSADLDTPIGPLTIPFHHDGTVPVLKIPEVDLANVAVRGASFTGADVRVSFHVRNPNALALDVQSLDYSLTLANAKIANGRLPSPLSLAAKSTGNFDADVHVSLADAAQAVQSLANRNTADYQIGGTLAAKTPWGSVSTPFTRSGTVKIQR